MARRIQPTAEFAFVTSGVLVAGMGWAFDLIGVLAENGGEAGHGGALFFRLNILFFALGLAGIGSGFEHFGRFLRDPSWALRYLAGYLILADGFLHAYAFNDHIGEPAQAAFFAIVAPAQIAVGLGLPHLKRGLDHAWLLLTAFLIAAYVVTRTVPVWPVSEIEEVEVLGILSKAVEVLAILVLVQLIREGRRARARSRTAASPADAGP